MIVYIPFCRIVSGYCDNTRGHLPKWWPVCQWIATGVLWSTYLMQDLSNVAVYLSRQLGPGEFAIVCAGIIAGLGLMFWQGGDKIQKVVEEKSKIKDIPEACLVDFLYASVLFVFLNLSNIPMSTTWCFVGLLAGREISVTLRNSATMSLKHAFKMAAKDLAAVFFGFFISLIIGIGANPAVRDSLKETFNIS